MNASQSQQLRSFYIAIFILASVLLWLFSLMPAQQKNGSGRILCLAIAKPQLHLNIKFDTPQAAKQSFNSHAKKAYPFKILSITKNSHYCHDKIGKIFAVYLNHTQREEFKNQSNEKTVHLKLILLANASLIKRDGTTLWTLHTE